MDCQELHEYFEKLYNQYEDAIYECNIEQIHIFEEIHLQMRIIAIIINTEDNYALELFKHYYNCDFFDNIHYDDDIIFKILLTHRKHNILNYLQEQGIVPNVG